MSCGEQSRGTEGNPASPGGRAAESAQVTGIAPQRSLQHGRFGSVGGRRTSRPIMQVEAVSRRWRLLRPDVDAKRAQNESKHRLDDEPGGAAMTDYHGG